MMAKQAGHLTGAGQQNIALELGISPLSYLLTKRGPRICMDREDNKNLEGIEASVWYFIRISRSKKYS